MVKTFRRFLIGLLIVVSVIVLIFVVEHYVFNPHMKGISYHDLKDLALYFYIPAACLLIINSIILNKLNK